PAIEDGKSMPSLLAMPRSHRSNLGINPQDCDLALRGSHKAHANLRSDSLVAQDQTGDCEKAPEPCAETSLSRHHRCHSHNSHFCVRDGSLFDTSGHTQGGGRKSSHPTKNNG